MEHSPWTQRPLPALPTSSSASWNWQLRSPVDVTVSRNQLRDDLAGGGLPADASADGVERLLLAYEELASNGLRHGRSPVHAHVTETGDGWLIDVTDADRDRPPTPALGRDPADGGLGLYLVARLCAAHGWVRNTTRKHVWACVRATG